MKRWVLLVVLVNVLSVFGAGVSVGGGEVLKRDKAEESEESEGVKMPEMLTKDTFDQTLSNGLHLVEFYSPYCLHCTRLAPIWRKVYEEYSGEAAKLGIDMLQVNCVEQGDLCDRESVKYYPNLRVYGPNQHGNGGQLLSSYPGNVEKTEEGLRAFLRDSAFEFGDVEKLNLPSKSKLLNTGDLAEILTGKHSVPVLLSFWPSKDALFGDINAPKDVFDGCPHCMEFAPAWNMLSNQLYSADKEQQQITLGHVNCESNAAVCKELGFTELLDNARVRARNPRVAAVLPRSTGNLIKYSGPVLASDMAHWAKRLLQNYRVESVTPYGLAGKMNLVNRLVNEPKEDAPGNTVSFVYVHENVVAEDLDVLPYLLDPVMRLPNVYLYKSNDTGFAKLVERQTRNLLRYIHYNESEPVKEFNKELFVANTVTSYPTLIAFKDDCLIPYVFQNFDPKDIRNPKLVESFIRQNSLPFISELTPASFKRVFSLKSSNIDKVVVVFLDTADPGHVHDSINKLSLAAHDYHYYWSEYVFRHLQAKRGRKAAKVARLKRKNANSVAITDAMAKEIKYDSSGQTVFTYLDLNKFKSLINEKGWNINGKESFNKGDAIIIERTGKFYYENDIYGNQLHNDPWILRNTLMSFHDNNYIVKPLKKNLINSPYGSYLRPMDYIHRHGFKGYLFVLATFVAIYVLLKKYPAVKKSAWKYSKLGFSNGSKNLGILGNIPVNTDDNVGKND